MTGAELLRHNDAGMRATGRLPMLVERSEIANVEREKRAVLPSCKRELLLIRGGVVTGLFGPQHVEAAATQVNSQTRNDVAVEVHSRTKSVSRPAELCMGLLFCGDEREDFVAMIEEVAQRVEDLGLGDAQRLGDLQDRFAAPVQRGHVAHGNSQPVNDGLASAYPIKANNVGMLRFDSLGHSFVSEVREERFFTSLAGGRQPNQSRRKDEVRAKSQGRKEGTQGIRSRCSQSSRWIDLLTSLPPVRLWDSPAAFALLGGFKCRTTKAAGTRFVGVRQ